jgi:translation initiation factor 2A
LVFTHTDVDATGQSYYGETSLYYLSITGNFDCRVDLQHPGPIHDVAWSPNAKEFIVVYGSMPAKSTLFDNRAQPMYELGTAARNTVKYSPSGRFFFIAGFGNLTGDMDVWERKSFKKISSIGASNSSTCEWSPDGRYIMTGTLYRRLKVDNGIKIWHYSGVLAHQIDAKEMYQVAWRPDEVGLWAERNASSPVPNGTKPPSPGTFF